MAYLADAAGRSGLFTDGDWILSENMTLNGGIGVIQLKHVGVGEFIRKDFQFISEETFKSLGCTEVRAGDVLISRMADPIGRACVVPKLPFRAVTAVDVSILRVDEEIADRWFVTHLCNSLAVRRQLEQLARGTTRSRITRTELGELSVPLPALEEQRRIASRLGTADRLRCVRRNALEMSKGLLGSVFLEMFGDPVKNPKAWRAKRLGDLGALDRGRSRHRPRNDSKLYGGPYPFIQTGDVAAADGYVRRHAQTYSEAGLLQSKLWPAGTLCITIAANIADTAILTYPACFPDSVVGFIPSSEVTTEYVRACLQLLKAEIERTAPQVAQSNINLEILDRLQIPLPPIGEQKIFSKVVGTRERLRAIEREAMRNAEHLFQTLLQEAFREGA